MHRGAGERRRGGGGSHRGNKRRMRKPSRRQRPRSTGGDRRSAGRDRRRQSQTKVCVHFLQGRCSWGARCKFAHGEVAVTQERPGASAASFTGSSGQRAMRPLAEAPNGARSANSECARPSMLNVLCDDKIVDILVFLDVAVLACAVLTCPKMHVLESSGDGAFGRNFLFGVRTAQYAWTTTDLVIPMMHAKAHSMIERIWLATGNGRSWCVRAFKTGSSGDVKRVTIMWYTERIARRSTWAKGVSFRLCPMLFLWHRPLTKL